MNADDNTGKPCIRVYEHVGKGVIVEYPTGVIYSNQAGGTSCLQPELEGAFVPFGNDLPRKPRDWKGAEDELTAWFEGSRHRGTGATNGLDAEDADFIDGVLERAEADQWIKVDRNLLRDSCEAWVWVTVLADEGGPHVRICSGFAPYPRRGVLTWTNSD